MKTLKLFVCLVLALLAPRFAQADLVGNYTADANTLFLLHFDEAAGGSVTANTGSKGGNFYTVVNATGTGNGSATPTVSTAMLGAPGYVNGATNFYNCFTNPAGGGMAGYDFNNSGAYQGEVNGTTTSPDRLAMTNLNMGLGGNSPWTLEANILVANTNPPAGMEIICTDSLATGNRGFQFRISARQLQFQSLSGTTASIGANLPTTGGDAYAPNTWYHVAATYDGTTVTLYWTLLNPTNGAAHVLTSGAATINATFGAVQAPLIIGNENRSASSEQFQGCIDEVRISSVCRGSGQMQFYSPLVTITQNPVSQNVDYNQPVTFSVGASSQFALGYQWRFNSNSIAGASNTSYVITNVATNNFGYYDCVVTNTAGNSTTSSEAQLVVGAANFLADRYSFTTDASDSIGGQNGTLFGDASVTNGALVLDGTNGTYMQLPANLFNGANASALTVEFWATYGTNPTNVYVFALGNTNFINAQGIVAVNGAIYSPHTSGGQSLTAIPGDPQFGNSATATGNLDGSTVHVACVIDPPDTTLAIYTNGILEAINTNFTAVSIAGMNDVFSYIGRSLKPVDPYLNASIDELRLYKGALSSTSIQQSDNLGPNTLLTASNTTTVPVAGFTGTPTNGFAPLQVVFTDASTPTDGSITNWAWNFGNGNSVTNSSAISVTNSYAAGGSYTVVLTVNGAGGVSSATNYIVVTNAPPVAGFSGTPTNGFAPLQVAFTDGSSGSITNWAWNFGDGNSVTNSSAISVTNSYAVAGSYTVILTVSGSGGVSAATNTAYIVVKPKPVISKTVLSNGSLVLSGTNGPAGVQYRILATTNVATALTNWVPVWTNVFGTDGSYSYTNTTPTNSAKFFILKSP